MRYFVNISDDRVVRGLYRLAVDDSAMTVREQRWTGTGWSSTESVSRHVLLGDGDLEEVKQDWARTMFPEAFGAGHDG